MKQNLSSICK